MTPGGDGAAMTAGIRIDGAQFHASMMPVRNLLALAWDMRI
jgi:hypothetical protein